MKRDHFSSLSGTGSLQDCMIRFNLFYYETSGFKYMVVKCSKIRIRLFPIFLKHPFVRRKKGGYKGAFINKTGRRIQNATEKAWCYSR